MHLSELNRPKIDVTSLPTARFFIVLFFFFISACVSTPVSDNVAVKSEQIFTPKQLREDLQSLDQSLRQIHPEPFSRLDIDSYNSHYQQLYENLSWPQRRHGFFQRITPLVSRFSDIHTRVRYPQQEYQHYLEQYGKFPLAILYSSESLIVVADQQKQPLVPVGAELLTINNVAIEDMLNKFKRFIPAETETGQRRMIQIEFPRLLWSLYQFHADYQVEYRWQGKIVSKRLSAVKQEPVKQQSRYILPKNPPQRSVVSHYGVISIDDKSSLLWLNDFNEQYDKFDEFLQQQFLKLKQQNKDTLILDLRYNQGGITDNLALLLSYLTAEPISWASRGVLKLSEPFRLQHSSLLGSAKNEKYGNYLDWLPVEYLNLLQWEILFSSDGEWLESEIKSVISDKENYFTGKIFVLSNGYCFSACASLVATLQDNKRATIIGESPGSLTEVQYGYPVEVELPNTGLRLVVPAMKFILNDGTGVQQKHRQPDYYIERRRVDVLSGKDPVFEFALELSKSHK